MNIKIIMKRMVVDLRAIKNKILKLWSYKIKKSGWIMQRWYLKTDPFVLPLWRVSPRGSSFGSLVTLGVPQPTTGKEKHWEALLNEYLLRSLQRIPPWQEMYFTFYINLICHTILNRCIFKRLHSPRYYRITFALEYYNYSNVSYS